jgi:hypothetical protein
MGESRGQSFGKDSFDKWICFTENSFNIARSLLNCGLNLMEIKKKQLATPKKILRDANMQILIFFKSLRILRAEKFDTYP